MAKMRYAEMPRDVSCDSLAALRTTDKTYHNGDAPSGLQLDLHIHEETDEDTSKKKKGSRTKSNSPRSPEKMGFNLMRRESSSGRSSFRQMTRSPSVASDYHKKSSAPAVLGVGAASRASYDNIG